MGRRFYQLCRRRRPTKTNTRPPPSSANAPAMRAVTGIPVKAVSPLSRRLSGADPKRGSNEHVMALEEATMTCAPGDCEAVMVTTREKLPLPSVRTVPRLTARADLIESATRTFGLKPLPTSVIVAPGAASVSLVEMAQPGGGGY